VRDKKIQKYSIKVGRQRYDIEISEGLMENLKRQFKKISIESLLAMLVRKK